MAQPNKSDVALRRAVVAFLDGLWATAHPLAFADLAGYCEVDHVARVVNAGADGYRRGSAGI